MIMWLERTGRIITLAIGLSLAMISLAEDAPEGADKKSADTPPAVGGTESSQATGAKSTAGERPKPDFTPSEEISEDLSVPFPADI